MEMSNREAMIWASGKDGDVSVLWTQLPGSLTLLSNAKANLSYSMRCVCVFKTRLVKSAFRCRPWTLFIIGLDEAGVVHLLGSVYVCLCVCVLTIRCVRSTIVPTPTDGVFHSDEQTT